MAMDRRMKPVQLMVWRVSRGVARVKSHDERKAMAPKGTMMKKTHGQPYSSTSTPPT